ncbi:MAG: hypothetical protein HC871_12990 [Rhizobiales bacterium]|nr:hypothetical protein [Hyphomicrobiales bacterium]
MNELIITNGDLAADLLGAAGYQATILPWRDVLHEGPVPATACGHEGDLEALSAIRAGFLAGAFKPPLEEITGDFERRDRTLRGHAAFDRVSLWFEHDLYDQLQLLQILSFFHGEQRSAELHLIQADDHLGGQSADGISRLDTLRALVTEGQMALAATLFRALRQPAPIDLAAVLDQDLSPLPHMQAALRRLFEELPSARDGLSRTQRQALQCIERDGLAPKPLFGAVQAMEEAVFMGDLSFWRCLDELAFNSVPLIRGLPCRFPRSMADEERQAYLDARLHLTDAGHAVLSGQGDHAAINTIDRWLGGTPIGGGAIWRWHRDAGCLVPPS